MTGERLSTSVNSMIHIQFSCHTHGSRMTFHQCEFYEAQSNSYLELLVTLMTGKRLSPSVNSIMQIQISCHTHDNRMAFHQCEFYEAQSQSPI